MDMIYLRAGVVNAMLEDESKNDGEVLFSTNLEQV